MDTEIGCYLQQLRTVRQISTAQLARSAGIGRATLNRWQTGKGQPRKQELEAVLNAMTVSPEERTFALALHPPTIKRIRQEVSGAQIDYADLAGPQPHCGDLLRALRLRNEKTQAEVAQLAGTAQATVARWESAQGWPEQARLNGMARALCVRDAELTALSLGPLLASSPPPRLEDLREQWQACWQGPHSPEKAGHAELRLLQLAAQTWLRACHSSNALKLLADIFTVYSERLYFQRRFPECEQMALRAQDIYVAIGNKADPFWARAVVRGSSALARKGSQRAIERAMRQLCSDFPGDSPALYKAWMLSELGKMAALRGHRAKALSLGREAVSLAQTCGDLSELAFRQEDMARIYLQTGHPQKALISAPSASCHPTSLFVHAEAHIAMGHSEKARQALLSASSWIDTRKQVASHETPYYHAELQALLVKL